MVAVTPLTHPYAKDVVLQVISHFNSRRFDLAAKLFTPDAMWHSVASPPSSTWGVKMLAIDFCTPTQELLAPFKEWSYTAAEVIVDTARNGADGTVLVDGIAKGFGPGTHRYEND
ncbi:hypothetical protein SCAR479_04937 [Seiridium cardinale]|uniref:SnoaL-like domain-containing protein n=1 Tax=Seiridium cardinale TaxID=138064 RepID=A0ABR2Y4R9_9PEZI